MESFRRQIYESDGSRYLSHLSGLALEAPIAVATNPAAVFWLAILPNGQGQADAPGQDRRLLRDTAYPHAQTERRIGGDHGMLWRTAAPARLGLAYHDDPVDLRHDRGLSDSGYGSREEYLQ